LQGAHRNPLDKQIEARKVKAKLRMLQQAQKERPSEVSFFGVSARCTTAGRNGLQAKA